MNIRYFLIILLCNKELVYSLNNQTVDLETIKDIRTKEKKESSIYIIPGVVLGIILIILIAIGLKKNNTEIPSNREGVRQVAGDKFIEFNNDQYSFTLLGQSIKNYIDNYQLTTKFDDILKKYSFNKESIGFLAWYSNMETEYKRFLEEIFKNNSPDQEMSSVIKDQITYKHQDILVSLEKELKKLQKQLQEQDKRKNKRQENPPTKSQNI